MKKTLRYPAGAGSGWPTASMTSGAQPCMPAAPWGAEEARTSLLHDGGSGQGNLLRDEAADGEPQKIHLAEVQGGDKGDRVVCHLLHSVRCLPGGAADSGVVEGDDTPGRRQRVDQRGVPVVEVSAEVLEEDQWHTVASRRAGVAVRVIDAVRRLDQLVRQTRVGAAAVRRIAAVLRGNGGHVNTFLSGPSRLVVSRLPVRPTGGELCVRLLDDRDVHRYG